MAAELLLRRLWNVTPTGSSEVSRFEICEWAAGGNAGGVVAVAAEVTAWTLDDRVLDAGALLEDGAKSMSLNGVPRSASIRVALVLRYGANSVDVETCLVVLVDLGMLKCEKETFF